ncbi:MAG: YdiU family protein [Sandaracinaceae bacterium]
MHEGTSLDARSGTDLGGPRLRFDNVFCRELPADPIAENRRRQVRGACFSWVEPTRVEAPTLLAHSPEVAQLLGLDLAKDPAGWAEILSGNRRTEGMQTYAACYGGHQFGHWAGQLGDGRAISLGEVRGEDGGRWELQLKGAGPTPYSRTADGRAVLRSSIREFLMSEAMHHLGVPTTRALSLVGTGESVIRDMFYDGRARPEPGAIVCRVAPSFLRFGNYQILAAQGDRETLRALVEHTVRHHFAELLDAPDAAITDAVIVEWTKEVARRTADMIVHWMRVGFVHGVMNTDNMSILGLTIDYGPYGVLDDYDPTWTPNTTDAAGRRYCYGRQPSIAHWNLARFLESIAPLLAEPQSLEAALDLYRDRCNEAYPKMLAAKLGLADFDPVRDESLLEDLLDLLASAETDMTRFFRALPACPEASADERLAILEGVYYRPADVRGEDHRSKTLAWLERHAARAIADAGERKAKMDAVNPKFMLRNYLAQVAIDQAEAGDPSEILTLLDVMRRPYDEQPARERYAALRPDWARDRAGCSMLSCSS